MRVTKRLSVGLIVIVLALTFAACGTSYKSEMAESTGAAYATASEAYGYDESYSYENDLGIEEEKAQDVADTSRKLIKTYNLTVETEEYEGYLEAIQAKVTQYGGYIENMNSSNGSKYSTYKSNRYSYLTIRIPVANADSFLEMVGENANVTNKSLSVEDVTLSYVDLESRKKAYLAEQDRLLELLEKAESLEDVLAIEDRLTNVRYNLESMEAQLRSYDNKIDYTTIYLDINEVKAYTEPEPEGYGARLARSFKNGFDNVVEGLKDFFVGFVGAIPGLFVLAVIAAIVIFVVKAIKKKTKKKSDKANTVTSKKDDASTVTEAKKE